MTENGSNPSPETVMLKRQAEYEQQSLFLYYIGRKKQMKILVDADACPDG